MCCLFDRKYADRGESPGTGQLSAGAGDTMYSDDSKPTVTGVCTVLIKIEDLYPRSFIHCSSTFLINFTYLFLLVLTVERKVTITAGLSAQSLHCGPSHGSQVFWNALSGHDS